jgi:sugar phosphate isomerase/epimerase
MIKIASMVGAPDLRMPTLAPFSGNLDEAFKNLALMGFEGVEIMTRYPSQLAKLPLHELLGSNKLTLVGMCTGHMFGEDSLGLLLPNLTINQMAIDRMKEYIDYCDAYPESGLMINIGRSRGVGDPEQLDATYSKFASAVQELADYALPKNVRFILEPVSRNEVNFIHTTQDGLRIVEMVNRPNFGLMVDTYHMHHEDVDLIESFYEAAPYIWHVHFSDSNRRHPGSGAIDYDKVVIALKDIGYEGYVSLEIQPWPDPVSSAGRSIEYLRQFIHADSTNKTILAGI